MATTTQDIHINFLSPLSFKFSIAKLDTFNKVIQSVAIPGFNVGNLKIPTPFIARPLPGDQLRFDLINTTFNVDEDFKSYMEIYNWSIEIGKPDRFSERVEMNVAYSDATLTILSSAKNPIFRIKYVNLFPVAVGPLQFDYSLTDNNPIVCAVSFIAEKFTIETLS